MARVCDGTDSFRFSFQLLCFCQDWVKDAWDTDLFGDSYVFGCRDAVESLWLFAFKSQGCLTSFSSQALTPRFKEAVTNCDYVDNSIWFNLHGQSLRVWMWAPSVHTLALQTTPPKRRKWPAMRKLAVQRYLCLGEVLINYIYIMVNELVVWDSRGVCR